MNTTLLKALIVLVLACLLSFWSIAVFVKKKTVLSLLQLLGALFLIVVAIVHIFEAQQLLTFMHWGYPYSVGHYLDLSSAVLGTTLFIVGFIGGMFRKVK